MKGIILLFLTVSISLASFAAKEQEYHNATLYLKDSTVMKGFIPFLENKSVEHVFFKINKEADVINIESIKIDRIVYVFEGKSYEYEYIKGYTGIKQKKVSKPHWIRLLKKGIVSLYYIEFEFNGGFYNGSTTFHDYRVKKENEPAAKLISSVGTVNKNATFKKDAAIYFSDYEELAKKIRNEEYKWNDIEKVVDIYNNWASKKEEL